MLKQHDLPLIPARPKGKSITIIIDSILIKDTVRSEPEHPYPRQPSWMFFRLRVKELNRGLNFLLQRMKSGLLSYPGRQGAKIEHDAATMRIDFDKDCFQNHSSSSTVCPFCPIGIFCKQEKSVQKEPISKSIEKTGSSIPKIRERMRRDVS